ncbi:MAG: endonuclease VII domain-containing protein [Candidatus Saccharimonadales bacterium]
MARDRRLRKQYGITLSQYNQMFEAQKGQCAICETHQSKLKHRLSVDHNHKTGTIRSLLCENCNHALGLVRESSEIAIKLSLYIQQHNNP